MKSPAQNVCPRRSSGSGVIRLLVALLAVVSLGSMFAQTSAGVGSITGRVFNPATKQYVTNAQVSIVGTNKTSFTSSDGAYRFLNVPEGSTELVVNYTGYATANATVVVEAGKPSVQNFNLSLDELPDKGPLTLDAFTVATQREGNAKAIMDQRASLNFRNIVAADSFGENPDGNAGEFLKMMPGVTVDYAFIQARGLRLNGLDPKYSSMTLDGISMASAGTADFSGSSRAIQMDAVAFVGIEAVELNKTLTADMDASAVTGNVNLRSKNAFDREGRLFSYNFSLVANSYETSLSKTPGWLQETQYKVRPNWSFTYADVFLDKKLGIIATYTDSTRWSPRDFQALTYDYTALATRGPLISQLQTGDEAVMVRGTTFALNADYKATERLVLSLRSTYSQRELPGLRRLWNLTSIPADILPESTLTNIVTKADGANTRLQEAGDVLNEKFTTSEAYAGRFKFKSDRFDLTGGVDYSRGIARYKDMSVGFFTIGISRLSSMSWQATRSDPFSTDWKISQLSGRPWLDPANFNLDSAVANNIGSRERTGTNEKLSSNLDATIPINTKFPFTLKAGVKWQQVDYKLRGVGAQNWSYVGPGASQTAATAQIPTETIYRNDRAMNAGVPHWPYPDRQKLYQIYQASPSYFVQDPVVSFREKLIYPRTIKDEVDSAYLQALASAGKLRLQAGLRFESTETTGSRVEQIPAATIAAARPDLVVNSIPYVLYQYHNGAQRQASKSYDDLFLSAGAKYPVRRNMDLELSLSDGILRPDYSNLAGAISVNETTRVVTVPNPALDPEHATKYYGGVSFYTEPAGALGLGFYVLRTKGLQTPGAQTTQADAGYADYPEFNNYSFISVVNAPGYQQTRGLEVNYRQQFTFLPGPLKGLSFFGSYSRVIADRERIGVVNRSGSAGLGYGYRRFNAKLNLTWQAAYLTRKLTTTSGNGYMDDRTALDGEVSFRVYKNTSIYLNGRNITDAAFVFYNVPTGTTQKLEDNIGRYGAFWTVGVKAQF